MIKAASFLLIALWIYAAASQLLDVAEFARELRLQPFSNQLGNALAWLIPALELGTVSLLLFKPKEILGFVASASLLLAFSIYIILIRVNYFGFVPCTCAGLFKNAGWTTQLVINLSILGLATFLMFNIGFKKRKEVH